ncbi:hypothetical protein C5167_020861 [Papaver somniferum]|uniref:Uncharacterized protein n=1 Tax=Papaver somniferum TaxID=3469 RepID=A0A4Y7IXB4_PAPSO|nr:hypothetical protein C5167_020861 [Papaver somniferum]
MMTISNRFHDKVTTELEWLGSQELSHDLVAEVATGLKDFDCIIAGPDLGSTFFCANVKIANCLHVLYVIDGGISWLFFTPNVDRVYTSCSERVLNAGVNSQDTSEEYRLFIKLREMPCITYMPSLWHEVGVYNLIPVQIQYFLRNSMTNS